MQNIRLKALIFDVGDILYDASVWRKWLTEELISQGVVVTYPQLVEVWERLLVDVYKARAKYWERFDELLAFFELDAEQIGRMTTLAREKGRQVQAERRPMPQVPETLQQLAERGVRLVALSDTESDESGIRRTLRQLGIEQHFQAVVASSVIGHVKPEPEAFDAAIAATECPKVACGFVAHDVDELAGAMQHRLFSIAYNYHPDAPADIHICHFRELLELV